MPRPARIFGSSRRLTLVPTQVRSVGRSVTAIVTPPWWPRASGRDGRRGAGGQLRGGRLHSLDDVLVPRAAAQVAGDRLANLLGARGGIGPQQLVAGHQ